jgi:peptide/nickel transport system permease protein
VAKAVLPRLAGVLGVVWVAVTLAFLVVNVIPGDPLDTIMAGITNATPELRARIAADLGLDKPLIEQYGAYLAGVVRGDLGTSYSRGIPVSAVILSELGATAQFAVAAVGFAVALAVGVALLTSGRRPMARRLAQFFELLALSVPTFWSGLLVIMLFAFTLRLLPASGAGEPRHLVLPTLTLALPLAGIISQVMRERMEHALAEPFVLTARARGAGDWAIRTRHVLRHSSLAVVTLSSSILAGVLSGSAVLETLFARPGIGRVLVQAVQERDLPLVAGLVIVIAGVFVVINTAVDLLYPVLDPRLRGV